MISKNQSKQQTSLGPEQANFQQEYSYTKSILDKQNVQKPLRDINPSCPSDAETTTDRGPVTDAVFILGCQAHQLRNRELLVCISAVHI